MQPNNSSSAALQELYDQCEKMRRALFKIASETEDNDNSLGTSGKFLPPLVKCW